METLLLETTEAQMDRELTQAMDDFQAFVLKMDNENN